MRAVWALVRYSLRRSMGLLGGFGALLVVFQGLAAIMAATFDDSRVFARIVDLVPPYLRSVMGASLLSMLSFTGIVLLGYFHVAITGSLVGLMIALGTEPAAEVERGFADLLLARPVSRAHIVTRSVIVLLVAATLMNAVMLGGTWAGLTLFASGREGRPGTPLLLSLAANQWSLMMCWGGVALAIGAASRRRGAAGTVTGLGALSLFLLDVVGRVWQPARNLRAISPFRYFSPVELISGQPLAWNHLAVLCGIGMGAIVFAYLVFGRRDV